MIGNKKEDPKFEVDHHVIISKYKINFARGYTREWSEKVFVTKKIKRSLLWAYVISDLNGKEVFGKL